MKRQIRNILFPEFVALVLFSYSSMCGATVLAVPEIFQEQDNWCWAGCSRATLLYYDTDVSQCTIADWAREQNGWGTDDCCENPGGAICNQANDMYGTTGSFKAILENWGVGSNARAYPLTQLTVASEIGAGRPFEIRWAWDGGGGHFLVGRGIQGGNIYYMDPWPGNGYSTASYAWVVSGGNHTWTHSLQITTPHHAIPFLSPAGNVILVLLLGISVTAYLRRRRVPRTC